MAARAMTSRRLSDEDKEGILESLTGGLSEVFGDTSLLFTDRAGFIAGEGSDSAIAQAVRSVSRLQCRLYAREPAQFGATQGNYIGDVCGPYLASIGEDPEPGTAAAPEVEGGQCPGVLYQVQDIGTNNVTGAPFSVNRGNRRGPIRSIENPEPPPDCGSQILARRYIVDGSGSVIAQANSCGPLPLVWRIVCTPVEPEPSGGCGDDGPRYNPPTPRIGLPVLQPETNVDLPGVGPVTVSVGFDPDGSIAIDLPDIGVSGTVNIGGDGSGGGDGGGGGGGNGAPPGDVGNPGTPGDTGDGGEADGEAPEGSVLVGLRIDFLAPPVGGNEYAPGVFRGVCYVYMGTDEGLDHDPAGAMLRSGQFVYAEKDNLTRWSVVANRGYNLRVTPYYRQVDVEET